MTLVEDLTKERRARLAAEQLLSQRQRELHEANRLLSDHALTLSEQIIRKRQQFERVKGQNSRVMEDLKRVSTQRDMVERRLWDSIQVISDGFAVFDRGNVLIAANAAYLSVFDGLELVRPGVAYADILKILMGEGIVDAEGLSRPDWCQMMWERWHKLSPEPKVIRLWNQRSIRLIDQRTETGDTVSLAMDITRTIRREENLRRARVRAESANRAKSAFLARMSHELRTPMNGVVGMAELLTETELGEEQRLFVDTIRTSGESLLSLINDILDFSRAEAEKLVLHDAPFNLEELIFDVMTLFQPAVQVKPVELAVDYDMFLPTEFTGDAARVRQVLTNLVGNAVKFTDQGKVMIRVVGLPLDDEGRFRIHITVEDTGMGIAHDLHDHIFGDFNQVEDAQNRRFEGTGLGLAISKQLVERMGGEIWVDSEPGRGSSFGFHLNLRASDSAPEVLVSCPKWISRIVLVCPQSFGAGILRQQLGILGLESVTVECQAKSIKEILQQGDVVVFDDFAGSEKVEGVIAALREHNKGQPIVLMQAAPNLSGRKDGGVIVVTRPVSRHAMLTALAAASASADAQPPLLLGAVTEGPRKMRVLAAEDNRTNRLVLEKLLKDLNIDLNFAENGKEAVKMWQEHEPDLIFMDISMPEMDGKEASRRIREAEKKSGRAPVKIVALTAHAIEGDEDDILSAGLDHYLTKPIRKAALVEEISQAIPAGAAPIYIKEQHPAVAAQ